MGAPRMVGHMEQVLALSVADLLDWCAQRDLDPVAVKVTAAHLKWDSPESPAEQERRERYEQAADARHEKWERETYERLRARFEET